MNRLSVCFLTDVKVSILLDVFFGLHPAIFLIKKSIKQKNVEKGRLFIIPVDFRSERTLSTGRAGVRKDTVQSFPLLGR